MLLRLCCLKAVLFLKAFSSEVGTNTIVTFSLGTVCALTSSVTKPASRDYSSALFNEQLVAVCHSSLLFLEVGFLILF